MRARTWWSWCYSVLARAMPRATETELDACPEAIQLAEGGKKLLPPGESLVNIALVAHVKDQAVPLRIEAAVDGHGELHRPQVGGQVPTGSGDIVQQELPQLLTKLRQLIDRPVTSGTP